MIKLMDLIRRNSEKKCDKMGLLINSLFNVSFSFFSFYLNMSLSMAFWNLR